MQKAIRSPRGVAGFALFALLALSPQAARAGFETEDFRIRSAQDLVDLCAVTNSDPLYAAAIHFCHGFVVGAWQYHNSVESGPKGTPLVCPPEPPPTRDQSVANFVAWSATNPSAMSEPAVDALFRFLIEKWPCPASAPAPAKKGASK